MEVGRHRAAKKSKWRKDKILAYRSLLETINIKRSEIVKEIGQLECTNSISDRLIRNGIIGPVSFITL